jgi:murein DD-endopeptidase MepM/ murein hydrolase activator NlpD
LHNDEPVLKRTPLGFLVALTLLTSASAGAAGDRSQASGATARAYGIRVLVPGQAEAGTPTLSAPNDAVLFTGSFNYNDVVTSGSANASVSAVSGSDANATASAEVSSLSVFNGEITASSIVAHAHATARAGAATGDINGSLVNGLTALGQPVASGSSIALADWGSLSTIQGGATGSAATGYRGSVTALEIRLTADHGGLPAGTTILVGYAEVAAQAAAPQPVTVPTPPKQKKKGGPAKTPAPERKAGIPPVLRPPDITPRLTAGGYVFPVYGPSSFIDTFGAFRGDVSGGWHHGDDIFAPLGAPILAVASGTVFSVGWNEIGGNRLWLRDGQGNLFYYAHLSAFSPLAVNGNRVSAGAVLGFVGNTGDAEGTPYHLHFEIHPVALLGLGYDGAVDPTSYLLAWKHLQDVSFAGGNAWAPRLAGTAPKPGAILIAANDISTADGLDPGSLQRALAPVAVKADAYVIKSTTFSPAGRPGAKKRPRAAPQRPH